MIRQTIITIGDRRLVKTYSDVGGMVRNIATGDVYSEAVDPEDSGLEYEEVFNENEEDDIDDAEALRIITGGAANDEN